jgi:hypothetical protein
MTCKEKLKLDHPDWNDENIEHVIEWGDCPEHYGYAPYREVCDGRCYECWDREIQNTADVKNETTTGCLIAEICAVRKQLVDGGFSSEEAFELVLRMFEGRLTPNER